MPHSVTEMPPPADFGSPDFHARVVELLIELWPLTAAERDVVGELAAFAYAYMDGIGESFASRAEVACRKGCTWCCSIRVTATAPEVFALARHIAVTRPELREQLTAETAVTGGLDAGGRAALRRWCPLLAPGGACSVYAARPAACRAVLSPDAELCRQGFAGDREDMRYFVRPMELYRWLDSALMAALHARGLVADKYELTQALDIALGNPAAEQDWLAGGDPLAAASATDAAERHARAAIMPVMQALGRLY